MNTAQENGDLTTAGNPHVLWRQVLGLIFWVFLLSLPTAGLFGASCAFALGGATFADAWISGIYKVPGKRSFLNISPMSWGILVALFFIAAYPVYLLNRNKLRTKQGTNAFFITTIVLVGLLLLIMGIGAINAIS